MVFTGSSKLKFVAGKVAFLLLVNALIKPLWIFGIELKVQNLLGPTIYGNYFALYNFVVLFMVFLDLGINNFNNREISRHPEKLPSFFSNIVSLKIFIALAYSLLVLGMAYFFQYSVDQIKLLAFLMMNQILISYILFFRSNLGALQLFRRDSLVSVLDKSLMILVCAVLIWGTSLSVQFDIWWFVWAQVLAYAITALVSFLLIFRKAGHFKLKTDFPFFKNILQQSYPFALLILLMGIYNRIDGVMLERMLPDGKTEAGIYAAAYRLLDAVNQFGLLSATILLPVFSRMIKKEESTWRLAKISGGLMFVFACLLAVFCWYFSQPIMNFLYLESSPYYAQIFSTLMFSFIGISSIYIFGTLLTANRSLKALNIIAVVGVLLNVLLNAWLIPQYQAYGASMATLFTQSLVALLHVGVAWWVFRGK